VRYSADFTEKKSLWKDSPTRKRGKIKPPATFFTKLVATDLTPNYLGIPRVNWRPPSSLVIEVEFLVDLISPIVDKEKWFRCTAQAEQEKRNQVNPTHITPSNI